MLYVLYVDTDRLARSQASATPCLVLSRSETLGPTVCVFSPIVERLAEGVVDVKHAAAAVVNQLPKTFLYNATI